MATVHYFLILRTLKTLKLFGLMRQPPLYKFQTKKKSKPFFQNILDMEIFKVLQDSLTGMGSPKEITKVITLMSIQILRMVSSTFFIYSGFLK